MRNRIEIEVEKEKPKTTPKPNFPAQTHLSPRGPDLSSGPLALFPAGPSRRSGPRRRPVSPPPRSTHATRLRSPSAHQHTALLPHPALTRVHTPASSARAHRPGARDLPVSPLLRTEPRSRRALAASPTARSHPPASLRSRAPQLSDSAPLPRLSSAAHAPGRLPAPRASPLSLTG